MSLALSMTREKTAVWFLTVTQSDGTAQPLTGLVLWFHAAVGGIDIDKNSPASGITITNELGGLATLQLEPSDTTDIPDTGVFSGPCELTLVSGAERYPLNSGTLSVSPNVGSP